MYASRPAHPAIFVVREPVNFTNFCLWANNDHGLKPDRFKQVNDKISGMAGEWLARRRQRQFCAPRYCRRQSGKSRSVDKNLGARLTPSCFPEGMTRTMRQYRTGAEAEDGGRARNGRWRIYETPGVVLRRLAFIRPSRCSTLPSILGTFPLPLPLDAPVSTLPLYRVFLHL